MQERAPGGSEETAGDELAVRSLLAGYSDAVMCGDAAAAASVFAEDGILQAFGGPDVVGRPAIEAALSARLGDDPGRGLSVQMTMTVGVRIGGDQARARSHYLEMSRRAEPGTGRLSMGSMDDELLRVGDEWRIGRRILRRVYVGDFDMPGKVTPRDPTAWLRQ